MRIPGIERAVVEVDISRTMEVCTPDVWVLVMVLGVGMLLGFLLTKELTKDGLFFPRKRT